MRKVLVCLVFLVGACDVLPEEKHPPKPAGVDSGAPSGSGPPVLAKYTAPIDWVPSGRMETVQKNCKRSAPDSVSINPEAVEIQRHGLFEYCPNTTAIRPCNTWCAPGDAYAGWWCDSPAWYQTQIMAENGICWIIGCDTYEPAVGFNVGGYGQVSSLFGLSPVRYQRNGSGVNTVHLSQKCWEGQQFPTWGWGEVDWGPPTSHPLFKSFACSNQVSW